MHSAALTFVGSFVDHEAKAQLVRIARRNDRSQSAEIRRALDSHLARERESDLMVSAGDTREAIAR